MFYVCCTILNFRCCIFLVWKRVHFPNRTVLVCVKMTKKNAKQYSSVQTGLNEFKCNFHFILSITMCLTTLYKQACHLVVLYGIVTSYHLPVWIHFLDCCSQMIKRDFETTGRYGYSITEALKWLEGSCFEVTFLCLTVKFMLHSIIHHVYCI